LSKHFLQTRIQLAPAESSSGNFLHRTVGDAPDGDGESSTRVNAIAALACLHCGAVPVPRAGNGCTKTCSTCGKPLAVPIAAPARQPLPIPDVALGSGLTRFESRHEALAEAQVVPEPTRCVQCGMCSYNCPMGIDVRGHAWRGLPVHDSHCVTCGECVKRCPRGVLRFDRIALFATKK
jgi:ferredoxin